MFKAGDKFGSYKLIGDNYLGRGGFGEVWKAVNENDVLNRIYAVKLPRNEDINLDNIKDEAQLWLNLSGHPNIVPFITAEKYNNQVIIVSEFAEGGDLLGWLNKHSGKAPNIDEAVKMMTGILKGLEHLHSKNVVHRDLKPANILLQGESPRLVDFGISKMLQTTHESSSMAVGTPKYMPPEAFDGKRSFQTDVWAIGVIFQQLLVGYLPFDNPDYMSLLKAIMMDKPNPLPENIPEHFSLFIEKCLEKEPQNRFQNVSEMISALNNNKLVSTVIDTQNIEVLPKEFTHGQKSETETQDRKVDSSLHQRYLVLVNRASEVGFVLGEQSVLSNQWLDKFELQIQNHVNEKQQRQQTFSSPISTVSNNLIKWIVGGISALLIGIFGLIGFNSLSNSQKTTSNTSNNPDSLVSSNQKSNGVSNIESANKAINTSTENAQASSSSVTPSPILLPQTSSRSITDTLPLYSAITMSGHSATVNSVSFSSDGKTLASGSWDKTIKLWNIETGKEVKTLNGHSDWVQSVSFSPDGKTLASGSKNSTIKLWNIETGKEVKTLSGHSFEVYSVCFSPDGKTLASGSWDKTIKLWNIETGKEIKTLSGHSDWVWSVCFSPDGKTLTSGSRDNTIKLWRIQ